MQEKQRSALPAPAPTSNSQHSQTERAFALTLLRSFLQWWYALSTLLEVPESANFAARERVRQGRVASLLIIGTFLAAVVVVSTILLAVPGVFLLQWTLISTGTGILCCLIAIPLNRRGIA